MSPNVVTREPQARAPQSDRPFLSDIKTLRQRARQAIEEGAVTPGYEADAQQVCRGSRVPAAQDEIAPGRPPHLYSRRDVKAPSGACG